MDAYATRGSLATQLSALGVMPGGVVLVHSSYKSLGFVVGGLQAVVEALLDAVGPEGTIVVPAHTPDNSDPQSWSNPPVPEVWWEPIRREGPGFDPGRTPTSRFMGRLAELVRTWPGTLRSNHPQVSFAAHGAHAAQVVEGHRLDDALGESSPLGAVYRLDGKVLLLGCGHDSNTSLHLSEWRQSDPPRQQTSSSIRQPDGTARWVTWTDVAEDEEDFAVIGAEFDATGAVVKGPVGESTARLMSQRELVDFGTVWIRKFRPAASERGD
jgi:aminoglycoside 3-N-acetyltransferase